MGTRADFYVGRGESAEWIGSIGWDGYPDGIPTAVLSASTEADFRKAVEVFASDRNDFTAPDQGWPWPWDNSRTTDYAYAFDAENVWASRFGRDWFEASNPEPEPRSTEKTAVFPDMSGRKATAYDQRSGMIIVGA